MYQYPPWGVPVPPQWACPPPPTPSEHMTPKQFRQWLRTYEEWNKLVGGEKKKEEKKEEQKLNKGRTFSIVEMFIILMAFSPIIYIVYNKGVIPLLLR